MSAKRWEFWVDRGGTFTDIVAKRPDGAIVTHKLLSENPEQYADAAVQGVHDLIGTSDPAAGSIAAVKMGTTVATNALLERKGEGVLLLITEGFCDLLKIGYQTRPDLFALSIVRPELLYAEVAEVPERLNAAGEILTPLDEIRVREALQNGFDAGLRAVAVALLHAYLNPEHEIRVAQIAGEIGFTQISTSHEVSRLAKLVGRGDTTVVDAYLSPILRRYVDQVAGALDVGRVCERLFFMQSSGGLTDAARFQGRDAILSGPAGGIVGMVKTAEAAGHCRLIGFDMGGTSTDVSHYAGDYERSFETEVAGVRMRAPMMDIHTVAAGGGSICRFADGRFQVGPESAGANPGPACYRRGGPLTVTDCNVLLGKLHPDHFPHVFGPDGNEALDVATVQAKFETLSREVAQATGDNPRSVEDIAEGFLAIAVDNMANAIKKISVQRGHDVTEYTLQCFGGAGGQHACLVAEALGMSRVLIHPFAGVLSAFGMGLAELREMREAQFDAPLSEIASARAQLSDMASDARDTVVAQGAQDVRVEIWAHLRYSGTQQDLKVAFADGAQMQATFEDAHLARFGFNSPDVPILFEMLSVEAIGEGAVLPELDVKPAQSPQPIAVHDRPFYDRATMGIGDKISGPAIVLESTGTNVIEAGWQVEVDPLGNLVLTSDSGQRSMSASTEADPVLLEVMSNLFMSVADQMGATLANTSQSVNIKERFDFSCAIFDGLGDLVANAPHVPVHLGSMSDSIKTVMRGWPDVADGDAFMLNSPYNGGTHLPDVTVVTPVFIDGKPRFWLGSRGHHADIGGRTPGSAPPDSSHIDEEGVLIDNMQLVTGGRFLNDEVHATLASGRYPCRNIDQNIADLKAQVAANATGMAELKRICTTYGADVVGAYMGHVQDNAEESVRRVIQALSDGAFDYPLDNGNHIRVAVRVNHADRSAEIDFTGTAERDTYNYNAPLAVCHAVVLYVFRTLVGAPIPLNEGCFKPLRIIAPAGTMVHAQYPSAVIAGNTEVSQLSCNALMGALGAMAGSQATMNNFVWGNDRVQNYETICGGTGAGPGFDGCSAVQTHMTNTRSTDPEVLETRFPVRLDEWSIRHGSGGAGAYRGGDGITRRMTFLEQMTVTTLCSHRVVPPFGANGGAPGEVGKEWVERADGAIVAHAGNDQTDVFPGDTFVMQTPSGGGWGAITD